MSFVSFVPNVLAFFGFVGFVGFAEFVGFLLFLGFGAFIGFGGFIRSGGFGGFVELSENVGNSVSVCRARVPNNKFVWRSPAQLGRF